MQNLKKDTTTDMMDCANEWFDARMKTLANYRHHTEMTKGDASVAQFKTDLGYERRMLRQAEEEIEALRIALRSLGRDDY